MKYRDILSWVFILLACALLSIGRVYDERLTIVSINLPLVISFFYALIVIVFMLTIKNIHLSKTKLLYYLFYLILFLTTPILWIIFDTTEYGVEKYINFIFIIIPISIIIIEKYKWKDSLNTLYVLLGVSCFLAFLSIVGLSISERADGRMATLGGGPIVFARWMGFSIISLFFLPINIKKYYKYILIGGFFILALSSGSRGPILSLILTGIVYVILNFNKIIVKISIVSVMVLSVVIFSDLGNQVSQLGQTDRVFMNVAKKGGSKQSTSTRKNLAIGSLILLQHYPLGVGAGNWQSMSNKVRPNHLMPLEYPHNLFLEVACEYGIHAVLVMLFLFIYTFSLSYKKMIRFKSDKTSLYPLLFHLLIFFFLNSLVSGMLNDSRLLFVIIAFILIKNPLIKSVNE